MQVWTDFSDVSTLYQDAAKLTSVSANDDPIGAAEDKSGNGNDCTQATALDKPLYKTGIQNSLSAALGDGAAGDALEYATAVKTLLDTSPYTVFVACQDNGGGGAAIFGSDHNSDRAVQIFSTEFRDKNPVSYTLGTNPEVLTMRSDESTLDGWKSGVHQGSATAAHTGLLQEAFLFELTISGDVIAGIGGYIFEVVVCNVALPKAERQAMERFLSTKWAITLA